MSTSPFLHGLFPFNLETVPLIVISFGASISVLSLRLTSPVTLTSPRPKLESDIFTSNNFPELSVTLPIVISVLSVGVT